MDEDELYTLKAYIDRSPNAEKILQLFQEKEKPLRPTDVAQEIGVQRPTASQKMIDLKDKELLEVINEEDNRNRYYRLTGKGRELVEELEKLE